MIIFRGKKVQLIFLSTVALKYLRQAISVQGLSVTPHCINFSLSAGGLLTNIFSDIFILDDSLSRRHRNYCRKTKKATLRNFSSNEKVKFLTIFTSFQSFIYYCYILMKLYLMISCGSCRFIWKERCSAQRNLGTF